VTVEEQAQLAQAFVGGVVERLGLAATTNVAVAEESTIEVSVEGEGLGLLIGPHGVTLRALQELTRTATQRRSSEHGTRVVVDVAGYRAKRATALAQFARSIAQQVIETGMPHSLEPMSASDRKIVHDTVNEIDGVRTASEGEESARHVVIYPVSAEAAGGASGPAAEAPRAEETGEDGTADIASEEDAVG
jgi:spoIIIJ-associated protein